MKVNQNITTLKPSSTLKINERVKTLRKKGNTVYHFGFGQSPFPIHTEVVKELKENAHNNHYLSVEGLADLRKEISTFLYKNQNVKAAPDQVFIGPGSKELLYQSILIFEGNYLIPKGSWVSYIPQIKAKGGSYEILETFFKDDFKLTPQALEKHLKDHRSEQQVLILNSPNNPTGAVYSKKEYKALAEVCRKYEVIVFSDEIYSQINFLEDFSPSISEFYSERTIVFGGLSKVFSAGGYRLGFMALPKEFKELTSVYRSLFSETFSCVAAPIQFAAVKAYEFSDHLRKYINASANILCGISSYISENLTIENIQCTNSQGAFYMMIGFENYQKEIHELGINTSSELGLYLLENYHVALLPGSDFALPDSEFFLRLAFVDFDGKKAMSAYQNSQEITEEFIQRECNSVYQGTEKLIEFVRDLRS